MFSEGGEAKVKFKLMTRKGHKQQLKELSIPLDSDLTLGLKDNAWQQAKMEDHQEIKQKILDCEQRQEEEEYRGLKGFCCLCVILIEKSVLQRMLLSCRTIR